MGAGILDATSINIGKIAAGLSNSGTNSFGNGTFTLGGGSSAAGTVKVTTLTLGDQNANTTGLSISSIFNLNNGGTLQAQTIQAGATVTGTVTRAFNWNNGTISNYDANTDLAISAGIPITLANTGTHTFNISPGQNGSTVNSVLSGTGGTLVKAGAGTLTLTAANTYTGGTTVNAGMLVISGNINGSTAVTLNGGTLKLGASNVLNDSATVTLASGTLATAGFSDNVGALTLNVGSTIDLGGQASILSFANSSGATWTQGALLTISNWNGNPLGGGADQIYFGSDTTGLGANLADVQFLNPAGFIPGTYNAQILPSGELVALVPEPGAWASLLGGCGILLGLRRRRH